jgi:hypothetical protein
MHRHAAKALAEEAVYFSFTPGLIIGDGDIVMKTPAGQVLSVLVGQASITFTVLIVVVAGDTIREVLHKSRHDY